MDEATLRSRQKVTSKPSNKTPEQEKDKMLIKNRKQTAENYDFGDTQRIPPNVRDIMDKNFFRLFTWELYFGYIFWTIFFGIGPMVMFFPMVKLAIHGYEVLILSLASPIILGSSFVNNIAESTVGKLIIRLIVITSLLSFQLEDPLVRLLVLSIGTSAVMIDLCTSLNSRYHSYRSIIVWTLTISLFFFLSIRVCFSSIMPAWSGTIANLVHFFIGLAVLIDQFGRDKTMWQLLPPISFNSVSSMPSIGFNPLRSSPRENILQPNWLLVGIGFGSLLFNLQWVFGDLSVVSRWASTGFPDQAPEPIPFGLLVWIGLFLGVFTINRLSIVTNRWWASVGFFGYGILYFSRGNVSFIGGLALSLFIGSVLPLLFDKIARGSSARIVTTAAYVYILQVVYAVWTSAYNFVPFGGTLTRETSHVLVFFNFLGIYFGVYTAKHNLGTYIRGRVSSISLPNRLVWAAFGIAFLIVSAGTYSRFLDLPSTSLRQSEDPTHVSAAVWTVHFGYDNNARPSLDRVASVLADTNADVIGLLETDTAKPFFGNTDLTSYLGEKLHMFTDFGPSTKDHTWGCIILSKYPIVRSEHYLLPSPEGELAPAILATVEKADKLIDVIIVHMGNDRDDLDRKLQAEKLRDIMKNSTHPLIFLGYVTSEPFSRDYKTLTSVANDIDSTDRDRWCEYILYKNLIRVGYARITHAGLTDTEIQMAKFQIPTSEQFEDYSQIIIDPSAVPDQSLLFNSKFGSYYSGHGRFNTHRFHMDTPKYFLPRTH
jgi:endonuclease/exonuclease/phosphatase family metal-dependent hydrolase